MIIAITATRHNELKREVSDVAVVLLQTPRERVIAQRLRKVLPPETPIISIETEHNSPLATIDLLVKANVLIANIAEKYNGINPCDPKNVYGQYFKAKPMNNVAFADDFNKWGRLTNWQGAFELKKEIDAIVKEEQQHKDEDLIHLPCPSRADISKPEEYDASKVLCYAFKKKTDLRRDLLLPLGNMNGGFPFLLDGVQFLTSETAYISGMFSGDVEEQRAIQQTLVSWSNGFTAKKEVRQKNADKARRDWNEFNIDWMLYCVWNKVKGNEEFRNHLLSVPVGATIIEDTTFQAIRENDTSAFWGCRNKEQKEFHTLVERFVEASTSDITEAEKDRRIAAYDNLVCNYGVFKGCNAMGKILTICRKCLAEGTEPEINYDLLNQKHIHLLGKRLTFDQQSALKKPKDILLGTIAGDMIGRPYERHKNSIHTTDFPLFEKRSKYTDDTVLTIAVMDWLLSDKELTWSGLAEKFVHYGTRYRIKGRDNCFGKYFKEWLFDENRPFGRVSEYNGSAMRVSPVGWFFDTVEEVERVAAIQASLTHNHPDAIQGAQVAAVAVLLSRQGKSKGEIKSFIEARYGYFLSPSIDEFRDGYEWTSNCKITVQSALIAFLSSSDFEGAIRNAVSLGGDADTIAAITGSIAEAFYGEVPEHIRKVVLRRAIPNEFKDVMKRFNEAING